MSEDLDVVDKIRKDFGEGAIVLMGEAPHMELDSVSTGSLELDFAIGVGGVPVGRITEIFGLEGTGKTTICQHIIANAQADEQRCAYIDMEHALDLEYVRRTGVDTDKLYLSQPDSGEQALEILERLVRSHEFGVIIVDSVAALVPTKELEGDMGDAVVGLQARLMSQAMRKLAGAIRRSPTAVVFTNQIRYKVGVSWGSPETTPGGVGLKFYAAVRIKLRRAESIKVGSEVKGNVIKARIVKNKVAPPFKKAEFTIMYNEGISKITDIFETGVKVGVIDNRGAYYYLNDDNIGRGKSKAKKYLLKNPSLLGDVEMNIRKMLNL